MEEEKYTISEKMYMLGDIDYKNHEQFEYKINMHFLQYNSIHDECYRDQLVSYFQMAPIANKTVPLNEADYIIYANPFARVEDFTYSVLEDLEYIDKKRKDNAEIIIVGKAVNIKKEIEGKYKNITYVPSHYAEYIGKRFGLEIKDKYVVYDDRLEQLNIWPVDGCLNKCGFCRRTYMHIPFESIPIENIKEQLDYLKKYHPEQMRKISLRAENLTQYGLDIYGKQMLHKVIDLINNYEEVEEFEFPIGMCIGEITPEILESICKCKKISQIGLNFEAGSDRLLKLINKNHTCDQAIKICHIIKKYHPEVCIDSTVMIGLPTEQIEDILELADLIEESRIDYVHCNYYGYSEKHPIAKYPQINEKVRELHLSYLIKYLKKNHNYKNGILQMRHEKIEDTSKRSVYRALNKLSEEQKYSLPRLLRIQVENFVGNDISIKTNTRYEIQTKEELKKRLKKVIDARRKSGCYKK